MKQSPNCSAVRAFTLIELLVVISIIALLTGILLPSLSSARKSAQGVNCLSNLRQINTGMIAFTVDNQQLFPQHVDGEVSSAAVHGEVFWFGKIDRTTQEFDASKGLASGYFGDASVAGCPNADFSAFVATGGPSYNGHNSAEVDYAYSATAGFHDVKGDGSTYKPQKIDAFRNPTETGLIWDSATLISKPRDGSSPYVRQQPIGWPVARRTARRGTVSTTPSPNLHGRHINGVANVGWMDGHANTFEPHIFDTLSNLGLYKQFNLGNLDEDLDPDTSELTDFN